MPEILRFAHVPESSVRTPDDVKFLDKYGPRGFDPTLGERVCRFQEKYLVPTQGPGADEPVKLLDWQRHDFFMPVFSYVVPDRWVRRFRELHLILSRQNGKSLVAAGTVFYMALADGEKGASCVIAACVQSQARDTLFGEVLNSAKSPAFEDVVLLRESRNEIAIPATNSRIKAVSTRNSKGAGLGKAHHCYALDEFCFWQDYSLYTSYKTALNKGTRRQPILLTLSSAGHDRSTPAYELTQYARAVRDGLISDFAFFPLLYETHEDDPIDSPQTWAKANPSIGYSVSLEGMEREATRAKHSKIAELEMRQYSLGQWVTNSRQFLNLDNWQLCEGGVGTPTGQIIVALDTSTSSDMTSVGWMWREADRLYFDYKAFCCRRGYDRRNLTNKIKYAVFEQEGRLEVHEGDSVDLEAVRQFVRTLGKKHRIKHIVVDPNHNASDTLIIFQKEGLPVERYGSGALWFNTPMRRMSEAVDGQKLVHPGDSCINWQAQNLEAKRDHEDRYTPVKGNDEAKIDVMVTLLMCVGKTIVSEATGKPDTRIDRW